MVTRDQAFDVGPIVEQIRPLLAGRPAPLQGAVLADLLAIFLAGHISRGSPAKTDALRERLLASHIDAVRELVKVNAAILHGEAGHD